MQKQKNAKGEKVDNTSEEQNEMREYHEGCASLTTHIHADICCTGERTRIILGRRCLHDAFGEGKKQKNEERTKKAKSKTKQNNKRGTSKDAQDYVCHYCRFRVTLS